MPGVWIGVGFFGCLFVQLLVARWCLPVGENSRMPIKETVQVTKGR